MTPQQGLHVGTAGGLCLPECSCGPGRGCQFVLAKGWALCSCTNYIVPREEPYKAPVFLPMSQTRTDRKWLIILKIGEKTHTHLCVYEWTHPCSPPPHPRHVGAGQPLQPLQRGSILMPYRPGMEHVESEDPQKLNFKCNLLKQSLVAIIPYNKAQPAGLGRRTLSVILKMGGVVFTFSYLKN